MCALEIRRGLLVIIQETCVFYYLRHFVYIFKVSCFKECLLRGLYQLIVMHDPLVLFLFFFSEFFPDQKLVSNAPVTHTHLRTLRMVRKARPQLSADSVTIRIISAENVKVRILSATYRKALSIRAKILINIKKVLRMKTTQ